MAARMATASACELLVGGMTCAACTGAVQGALLKQPGVFQAHVDILRETARIAYDSACVTPEKLCAVVQGLGFEAQVLQIFSLKPDASKDDNTSLPRQKLEGEETTVGQAAASHAEPHVDEAHTKLQTCGLQPTRLSENGEFSSTANDDQCRASLRFVVPTEASHFAAEACRSLESTEGVMGCSVCPLRSPVAQRSLQLTVTYSPKRVGARKLLAVVRQLGLRPSLIAEDPLETQVGYG